MSDFTDLGSLGATGSSANNQATLVLTIAANVTKGQLMLVAVADDNRLSGADSDGAEVSSVVDNGTPQTTFTKIIGWSNNNAAAQAGASVSLWAGVAKSDLTSGVNTITATFTSSTLSDATALTARLFSYSTTGSLLAILQSGATNTLSNDAADPGSLDATTANAEHLRVRGIGAEVGNNTNLTPTANWVAWANGNSATTGTTAEMCARAEHHISTGTTDASNPTYVAADCASVYGTFRTQPIPFRQDTWERPTDPLSPKQPEQQHNLLSNTLTPQVVQNPFIQSDWPNAAVVPLNQVPQFEPEISLALTFVAPVSNAIFRAPLIARMNGVTRAAEFDPPNLLGNTLTPVVVQTPFIQSDWPTPVSTKAALTFDPVNLPIATQRAQEPFAPDDWPTPYGTRKVPEGETNNLLLSTLAQSFSQTDWPTPAGTRKVEEFDPPDLLTGTLYDATQHGPFEGRIGDVIRGAPKAADFIPPNILATTLQTVITKPFHEDDWSGAKLLAPAADYQPERSLALLTAPTAAPFLGYAFPVLASRILPTAQDMEMVNTLVTLLAPPTPPVVVTRPEVRMICTTGKLMGRP